MLKALAYLLIVVVAGYSAYRSNEAIDVARNVDRKGDLRACNQENLIRSESNERNASLEKTAKLVVRALDIISKADRFKGDMTNAKLRQVASDAREVQSTFDSAKLADCQAEFPKP